MATLICFGEMLLRLASPAPELLLQSPRLDARIGGAETNVAISLARLGHEVGAATVLPDNTLGKSCVALLRQHGIDTSPIRFRPGRLGLYFLEHGAGYRPAEVIYDRADSAFALAEPDLIPWRSVLQGAKWLHVSGITAAVSQRATDSIHAAMRAAREAEVAISFDCNFRASLWAQSARDPRATLGALAGEADLVFGEERDLGLILGESFLAEDGKSALEHAANAAFRAFPRLQMLATTRRAQHTVDRHDFCGISFTPAGQHRSRQYSLEGIVDRIGGGDAFAAGILHGVLSGLDPQTCVEFATAAACLKHFIPGDFNLSTRGQITALLEGSELAVKR